MLTAASFRRFKALEHVDLRLGRSTCIVGANASGKTSLLEGIHCLTRLAAAQRGEHEHSLGRMGVIFGGRFAPQRIRTASASGPIEISLHAGSAADAWQLRVELLPGDRGGFRAIAGVLRMTEPSEPVDLTPDNPAERSRFYSSLTATGLTPPRSKRGTSQASTPRRPRNTSV